MGTAISPTLQMPQPEEAVELVFDVFFVTSSTLPVYSTNEEFVVEGGVVEGFFFGAPPGKLHVALG